MRSTARPLWNMDRRRGRLHGPARRRKLMDDRRLRRRHRRAASHRRPDHRGRSGDAGLHQELSKLAVGVGLAGWNDSVRARIGRWGHRHRVQMGKCGL
jgi:hypothetical protein